MTRTHQLETTLRSLKLSGMLDTLEGRLAQAHAGELGHVEFLQSLCEDELARRDAAGIVRRVRAARFEQVSAMEDFDFNANPKIPAARIRDLATLRFLEAGESVILHGPVGVGKTMVAQALGHQACSPWLLRTVHQDQSAVGRSGRRARRPHLGDPAQAVGTTGRADP
ncbi:MAG TPA: ATP-binding protein [Acidimicrobiales bacterium]